MVSQFDFGANWQSFSANQLGSEELDSAVNSLTELIGVDYIQNKSFLDIGCGSGIFALAAKKLGATKVLGIDLSQKSIAASESNAQRFNVSDVRFVCGSILDPTIIFEQKYDLVYSWGVLHHTGKMWQAIERAIDLTAQKGLLVIAIYNRHWTSPIWRAIKYLYNILPQVGKIIMLYIFWPIVYLAKLLVTKKNPQKKSRGMNFYYDLIDWLGGYPYEYAGPEQIIEFVTANNFSLVKFLPAEVPTGCHQYVFQRQD